MSDLAERAAFAIGTVLPVVNELSSLFSRVLSGGASLAVAKAQLRTILDVGVMRLQNAEAEDRERDKREDERLRREAEAAAKKSTDETTKP